MARQPRRGVRLERPLRRGAGGMRVILSPLRRPVIGRLEIRVDWVRDSTHLRADGEECSGSCSVDLGTLKHRVMREDGLQVCTAQLRNRVIL